MPRLGRSFQSRVERRIALLFASFCVAPLVIITIVAVEVVENQSIQVAERHLGELSKDYAMHLVERLEVAEWELRRGPADGYPGGEFDGQASPRWIEPLPSLTRPPKLERSILVVRDDGLELQVPIGSQLRRGLVSSASLFTKLDHTPYGVRRCIEVGAQQRRCAGESLQEPVISGSWTLPLSSLYQTGLSLQVTSAQGEGDALRHIGLPYRVLPYLVFALMGIAAWLVLAQVRTRFAPITELHRATQRIQDGDYTQAVSIDSGDEFQRLGEAFNAMAGQLGASFATMRTLSNMDRMALSGAKVEDLVHHALLLMRYLEFSHGSVWLWDLQAGTSDAFRLDDDGTVVVEAAPLPAGQLSLEAVLAAADHAGRPFAENAHALRREGVLTGVLGCQGSFADAGSHDVLAELGDRISIGLTLHSRANALYRQAHYDSLTGLLNREAFRDRVDYASGAIRRDGGRGALLCLDLDRFKQINDTEGHHVGDRLLALIGERLSQVVRSTDAAARMGGDEFAVLVPQIDETADIDGLCGRLIRAVNEPLEVDGGVHVIDVSVGVAVLPDDGDEVDELLRKADVAMYQAKEQSGSTFTFFDAVMNRETERRASIEGRLRQALRERELCLYFQPKIRTGDATVVGVEGLLRWPSAPDMSPADFIPVAEHTGLIHEFTDVLIEDSKVCLEQCRDQGFPIGRVAINVSPRQFQRPGFAGYFLERLRVHGADPVAFEIEVTESVFMKDPQAVARELEALRAAGITIALDDFGTGYSSLNVLRELPLDVIKIDRSFVAPISGSPEARDLIGRIIDIIRSLNLEAVAEGVETDLEMEVLSARHCHVVQGYLFSPAVPVADLIGFLQAHAATLALPRRPYAV